MNALQPSPLLRNALLVDGLLSGVTGLLLVLAAGWLGAFLELPRMLLLVAGSALLPFAAMLVWLANRAELSRPAVWAVLAVNVVWVIDSLLLLVIGWVCTVLALRGLLSGLALVGPARAAVLSSFEILVAIALAVAVLGERPGAPVVLGGALIVGAVALQRPAR